MIILGISAFYHDSAATLIKDGVIVAAAQEERFTRKKHDNNFPINAIKYCLDEANIELDQVGYISFYDKPLLKFERLLETYYAFAPKGISSFIAAMPQWIKEKLFLKSVIKRELKSIKSLKKYPRILFPEHHLSHAASTFYTSKYTSAAILTIDGVGEWATASICYGNGKDIQILNELHFPHSLGLLYSAVTYYLGFRVNSGEYKLMGLAPYGVENSTETNRFIELMKKEIIEIYEDGSIWLNQKYFNYAAGLRMTNDSKWYQLFGVKRRSPETEFNQTHCNLALAIQKITEEVVVKMARYAKNKTNESSICLSGGVALNCVANGVLQNEGIFENIFIQPAAGDAGGALGAALAVNHIYLKNDRSYNGKMDELNGAYLGPVITEKDIKKVISKYNAVGQKIDDYGELADKTSNLIIDGKVVGWVQGRMEFGPRALGNRSILGDPRNPEMQKKLNLKIKYRESFRPFAPAVLEEDSSKFFKLSTISPYMLFVHKVSENIKISKPKGFDELLLADKLYFKKSSLPAITHVDYSARIQTVHEETNPRFYELIQSFKRITGVSVLVNTSFNVRGEPIVCTAEDAYRCFMRTEMDILVIGDYLFIKENQPEFSEKDNWKKEIVLD